MSITDTQIAKATTPNEDGRDRPCMADIKATLNELREMPEKDVEELRAWCETK